MARQIVTEPGDCYVRDKFHLVGWVLKPKNRRQEYFSWCDESRHRLARLTGKEEISDKALVIVIGAALEEDGSFYAHVVKTDAQFLANNENWDQIYRAGAGTIYYEYLVAVEEGQWL